MTSPVCTVNATSTGNGVNVASASAVTIQLFDTAGVNVWSIKCLSTDDLQVAANITASLSINSITKTATFTAPTTTVGAAMIFESKVNGGIDVNGRVDESLTTRFGIFIPTNSGSLRIGAFDETVEGNASFGWTAKFNAGVRAAAASALTPTLSGTLPIVVNNANPAAPIISINEANTLLPGAMSVADKTILNNATAQNTASTLVKRSVSGVITVSTLSSTAVETMSVITESLSNPNGNLTLTSDGFGVITLDGNGTGELLVPMPTRSEAFKLTANVVGVVRSIPIHWRAKLVGGVESWESTVYGTAKQSMVDPTAECYIPVTLPHGVTVTNVYFKTKGEGVGPVPGNLPSYGLFRQTIATLSQATVGNVTDAGGATYRSTSHVSTAACSNPATNVIDRATYRYYIRISPEYGTNSVIGLQIDNISVELTFPAEFNLAMGLG